MPQPAVRVDRRLPVGVLRPRRAPTAAATKSSRTAGALVAELMDDDLTVAPRVTASLSPARVQPLPQPEDPAWEAALYGRAPKLGKAGGATVINGRCRA